MIFDYVFLLPFLQIKNKVSVCHFVKFDLLHPETGVSLRVRFIYHIPLIYKSDVSMIAIRSRRSRAEGADRRDRARSRGSSRSSSRTDSKGVFKHQKGVHTVQNTEKVPEHCLKLEPHQTGGLLFIPSKHHSGIYIH